MTDTAHILMRRQCMPYYENINKYSKSKPDDLIGLSAGDLSILYGDHEMMRDFCRLFQTT